MARISRSPSPSASLALALAFVAAFDSVVGCRALDIRGVNDQEWDSLNSTVLGRLHIGTPVNLPCFTSYQSNILGIRVKNSPDAAKCQAVEAGLATSAGLIKDFGSYHNPTFATCMATDKQCTLSASSPPGIIDDTCNQGTVPDFYVDARDAQDIQHAMALANRFKIPITVKNTGHDYKGRSTGPNTLAIWTHNIVPKPVINENFTPESCPAPVGPVVTYGAGQIGTDLYDHLDGTGYLAVGGSCPTVGLAGGWVAGGGHGIVSPTFGLGVDNAIQMKVVLANGTLVTANRCQNQDMFFALRGGGGGTFGVVTETTAALHKDRPFIYAFLQMTIPVDPRQMNEILVANAVKWANEGWGGLYGVDGIVAGSGATFLGFNPNLSLQEATASLKPVTDYFNSLATAAAPAGIKIVTLPNHRAAQNAPELLGFLAAEAGVSLTRSSRLVPRRNFKDAASQKAVVDVLMKYGWAAVIAPPTRYALPKSDMPGGPGEASITPAWREALWHFTYTASWDQADPAATTPEVLTKVFTTISQQMDPMRAITPGAGAYQNEGDVYEPNPIDSFWGQKNYARLLKIKKEVDPNNLLSCFDCVGWDKHDRRHRCYLNVRGQLSG